MHHPAPRTQHIMAVICQAPLIFPRHSMDMETTRMNTTPALIVSHLIMLPPKPFLPQGIGIMQLHRHLTSTKLKMYIINLKPQLDISNILH